MATPRTGDRQGVASLLEQTDWRDSPLGERDRWPTSLNHAVALLLPAAAEVVLFWGPEYVALYNDAYAPTIGDKHPRAFGRPAIENWRELWDDLEPLLRSVRETGETVRAKDRPFTIERHGHAEQVFFDISYSAVPDETGAVGGVLCIVGETTERVLAERRARELGERYRLASRATNDAIWDWDFATNHVLWNEALEEAYGHAPETVEPTGEWWVEQIHPDDRGRIDRSIHAAIDGDAVRWTDEYRFRRADGGYAPVLDRGSIIRDADGRAVRMIGAMLDLTERRRREADLRAGNQRFRAAVAAVEGVLWTNDAKGEMRGEQPGWEALTGQSFEDYQGFGWASAVHPDDARPTIDAWNAALAERRTFVFEHRVRRADGEWRLFSIRANPSVGVDGRLIEWVGVHTDITDQRAAEDRLRANEAELRAVLDTVPVGIVMAEAPSGRITGGNEQAERIFRHPVLSSPDADSYGEWTGRHPDGRRVEAAEYPLHKVIRGIEERPELEVLYQRGDGTEAWMRLLAAPIRDEAGAITGGVVAALDIDREKRAEERLTNFNRTLEREVADRTAERDRVWANSRDLLAVVGLDGVFRAVNPAWTDLLGYEPARVIGRHFREFIAPEDIAKSETHHRVVVGGDDRREFENRYRHRDGSPRDIAWRTSTDTGLVYAYGRDVTAERRQAAALVAAEEQLRQSQKLEAIGQLTGGVAHDFNNLLTVIRGSVDILRRDGLTDEKRERYVDAIGDTADRAAKLTGQLLAFARRQSLKPELFDAGASLREVAEMIRTLAGSRIELHVREPTEPCFIMADRGQFDTALVNLGINARDAMDGEGRLTMATGPVSGIPEIRSHPPVAGDFVAVTIADTGGGIEPDMIARIFEPFFTTKEVGKGTGLGLSQVIGFAKQSGGDIRVDSTVGEGTVFTLYLPRAHPGNDPERVDDVHQSFVGGEGLCVLLVEDNEQVGAFATQALKELGYDSVHAVDADRALDELAKDCGRFHVVFSDVVMPGMSGLELGREIRGRYPEVPVVLTSGYSHVLAQNGKHGFELLHKPYSVEQLSRVLRKAVAWAATRRAR